VAGSHCLWWSDDSQQVEVAFILPTDRCLERNRRYAKQLREKELMEEQCESKCC